MFKRSLIAIFTMASLLSTFGCTTSRPPIPPVPPARASVDAANCPNAIPGGYLVGFVDSASLQTFTANFLSTFRAVGDKAPFNAELKQLTDTVLLLRNSPVVPRTSENAGIRYVDNDAKVNLLKTPSDGDFDQQCGLKTINAEAAWDLADPTKAHDVKVAIVDSGIAHRSAFKSVSGDNDLYGHGTHLAGIIGAAEGDGGTVGVVWDVKLYGYSFTDSLGNGTLVNAVEQLDRAIDAGPDIVVLAWGSACPSQAMYELIVGHPEILFVAAAGNKNSDLGTTPIYPAVIDAPNLITVMATLCIDAGTEVPALFTSYGNAVDIAAPGADAVTGIPCGDTCGTSEHGILSTVLNDLYCCAKGTSMSAAFVAGAAALVKSHRSTLKGGALKTCLMDSAYDLATLAGKCNCGRLDLLKAVVDGAQQPLSCK